MTMDKELVIGKLGHLHHLKIEEVNRNLIRLLDLE